MIIGHFRLQKSKNDNRKYFEKASMGHMVRLVKPEL